MNAPPNLIALAPPEKHHAFVVIFTVEPAEQHSGFFQWHTGTVIIVIFTESKSDAVARALKVCECFRYQTGNPITAVQLPDVPQVDDPIEAALEPYTSLIKKMRADGGSMAFAANPPAAPAPPPVS